MATDQATDALVDTILGELATEGGALAAACREAARARILAGGLPQPRDEAWRYSDVRALRKAMTHVAGPATVPGPSYEDSVHLSPFGPALVLTNGYVDLERSRVRDPLVTPLRDAARPAKLPAHPWGDVNALCAPGGAHVHVPANHETAGPLVILHATAPDGRTGARTAHPRLHIEAQAGARAKIVEIYLAHEAGPDLVNASTDIRVASGAHVKHLRLQLQGARAMHLGSTSVAVEEGGHYAMTEATWGGPVHRHSVHVQVRGEHAHAALGMLYVLPSGQHSDTHVNVEHVAPSGTSDQLVKGILAGNARGAFTGKVHVHPAAQQIVGKQAHHGLLLHEKARVDTRPQLEIYADDVQCAHGATVGQLDEEAIGYMRTRGIGEREARRLLVRAFAHEVVRTIEHEALRADVQRLLQVQMDRLDEAAGTARA